MQPSFFTPSHRSPLARSIPAQRFTILTMPAFTLVLSCSIALFWWPRKLNDMQFGKHVSCSGMSLWRHITPPFKAMALRSSTYTTACRFGRTQPMPSVNSRTIYQCARKYARKGHSRSPTGSSCYILLSTKLIEREHPVGINHALMRTNLAVAPFWFFSYTPLIQPQTAFREIPHVTV